MTVFAQSDAWGCSGGVMLRLLRCYGATRGDDGMVGVGWLRLRDTHTSFP